MKLGSITFDKSAARDLLELFGKTVDSEGFIVEKENQEQRVLTKKGEEIHIKEWAGVLKGSEEFVKEDASSLIELAKRLE